MDRVPVSALQDFLVPHGYGKIRIERARGARFAAAVNRRTGDVIIAEVDRSNTVSAKDVLAIQARLRLLTKPMTGHP
jgi:hypothetical protein